ncbi:peroxiredoxin family protein [Aquihabitans sp. McL0605]|uniref:peroxiredoxin family protein n=1 Tax=Aquihabitans sp. McL0605 TaxID=3415671 RepID=UPI003CF1299E
MSNGLTGQFDAVLEVSAASIQRLLMILHRNDHKDARVPTLPHHVELHLDEPGSPGHLAAQVGVPILSLHDGSTDTFHLDVGIRAEFLADEGATDPLPQFINGTIGADYRMEPVDPTCMGWQHAAKDHVWLRVVAGSVTFRGTTVSDLSGLDLDLGSPELTAQIQHLVERLLQHQFEATPHRVSSGFRPGHLVQLDRNEGNAVAIPVGLDGSVPSGSVSSISRVFLYERDLALAVSRDVVLARIRAVLDDFQNSFGETIRLHFTAGILGWDFVDIDITWGVAVSSTEAVWVGPAGPVGGVWIDVKVHGDGTTQKSEYNWTFDVVQRILLKVNAGNSWVSATPVGNPSVVLNYGGPYADEAKAAAQPQVEQSLQAQIQTLTGNVGADLGLGDRAADLSRQLATLDPGAFARFDATRYDDDGIVLVGTIWVSSATSGTEVAFAKRDEGDGYTAFASWMPGGRIDRYSWSWQWHDGSLPPDQSSFRDRWSLVRAAGRSRGPFGVRAGISAPLPGIDGPGKVKLVVAGVYVDDVSGELVDFTASSEPIDLTLPPGTIPHQRLVISTNDIHGPIAGEHLPTSGVDIGLHTSVAGYGGGFSTGGSNVLVVRPGSETSETELTASIATALAGAGKEGTGLQVVVLHPEGTIDAAGIEASAQQFHREVGALASTFVSFDVDGTWADALALPVDTRSTVMALVTPQGGTSWMATGEPEADELSAVLGAHLVPAPPPSYERVDYGVSRDDLLGPWALAVTGAGCPPPPIGRQGRRAIITFVRPGSTTNLRALTTVKRLAPDPDDVFTAVVVQGAAVDGSELRTAGLAGDAVPIADPDGELAERFGVRTWPTTILVDAGGVVRRVIPGAGDEPGALGEPAAPDQPGGRPSDPSPEVPA